MFRRFIVLVFVSGVSGTLGISLGFLFAPAPGPETRAAVATFVDSHEELVAELYSRSSEAFDNVVSTISAVIGDAQD